MSRSTMANPTASFSLLLSLLFLHCLSASLSPDIEPLLSFKASAGDGSSSLDTWTSASDPCSPSSPWYGVSCFRNRVSKLVLEDLSLSGGLPASLSSLSALRVLSLSRNHLSGPVPDLSNFTSLKLLFLSHNALSGPIPDSLSSLSGLYRLDLSFNRFSGAIPPDLSRLSLLLTLRLDGNDLSGPISGLSLPNVQELNVSGNDFVGEIPNSLSRFPAPAFAGNRALCGPPLAACKAIYPASAPKTTVSHHSGARMSSPAIIAVVIGDFGILALVALLLVCFFWRSYAGGRRRRRTQEEPNNTEACNQTRPNPAGETGRMVFFEGARKFELEELLRASAEVVGKGAAGTVYRATMGDGSVVAVKRLRMEAAGGKAKAAGEGFERRMEAVGRLSHPNVAEVRAYYFAKEERLLVFDYMPNGSLFWLLHGNRGPGRTPLDWTTRLKIASGAARGVAYLHSACKPLEFTHGNIKSTNVLIDKAGDARVSDFGFPPPAATLASCRSNGYRAPEAVLGRPLTQKADVYSFGVLLLELLTGKCPATVEEGGAEPVDLRRWVESVIREEWTAEVFDVELMRYKDIEDEMVGLLHIALACTTPSPEQRPTMAQVVKLIDDLRGRSTLVSSSHDSPSASDGLSAASQ